MPKKLLGLLICFLLSACGTFKVQVQILPLATATQQAPTQPPLSFPTLAPQVLTPTATPYTAPFFSPDLRFSQAVGQPESVDFPPKTQQIYASWDYANLRPGLVVRREWYLNGQLWLEREEPWDFEKYGARGTIRDISIYDLEAGLPSGSYELRLFIDNVPQFGPESKKTFFVQEAVVPVLVSITMSDTLQGWGLEQTGQILKTQDGGQTWQNLTPAWAATETASLFALNSEAAWAVPANGVIWRTQDGGQTWKPGQPLALPAEGNYRALSLVFPDARHGWASFLAESAVTGPRFLLFRTEDGGENWQRVSSLESPELAVYLPDTKTSLTFFDGLTGWVGGWWGQDDPNRWVALKTVDGGNSWQVTALPAIPNLLAGQPTTCSGSSLVGLPAGTMAVDQTCAQGQRKLRQYAYLSPATQPNWKNWSITGEVLGVDFLDAHSGWMMMAGGQNQLNELYRTLDGGLTWIRLNRVAWKTAQFDFVSRANGWAVVGDGQTFALLQTVNGGVTWMEIKPVLKP